MLVIITGLIVLVWVIFKTAKYLTSVNWQKINGKITNINTENKLEPIRFAVRESIYPIITYEYVVNSVTYQGHNASFDIRNLFKETNSAFGGTTMTWESWKNNSIIEIFYNHKQPAESVVIRSLLPKRRSHYLALTTTGVLLVIIGTLLELLSDNKQVKNARYHSLGRRKAAPLT